jgi:hypothetical protein
VAATHGDLQRDASHGLTDGRRRNGGYKRRRRAVRFGHHAVRARRGGANILRVAGTMNRCGDGQRGDESCKTAPDVWFLGLSTESSLVTSR